MIFTGVVDRVRVEFNLRKPTVVGRTFQIAALGDMVTSKILVTGGTGLLGSRVLSMLPKNEYEVFAPARQSLDLSDKQSVENYLIHTKPTKVIHCAALVGGILANIESPADFLIKNLIIDANIIDACRQVGIREFLYIGSSCMYPAVTKQPMEESQLMSGALEPTNSGYAVAKLVGLEATRLISKETGWAYRTIIPSNLYGVGESRNSRRNHLIAAIMVKMWHAHLEGLKEIVIWGTGNVRREFTFVDDLAQWIVLNIDRFSEFPPEMNLGYGQDFSVLQFYEIAAKVSGFQGEFKFDLSMPEGMRRKLMDSSIARNKFGWVPATDPLTGMTKIWDSFLMSGGESDV